MNEKKQHTGIIFALIAMVCTIAVVALIGYYFVEEDEEVIQGQIEVSEYRVSSKVPGRVLSLNVKEGDFVKTGDILAELVSPELTAQESSAQAAVNAASAVSDMADNGAREEQIRGALELWNQAKAGLEVTRKTFNRIENLYSEGVITAQKRDEAEAALKASEAQEAAAKSQYDMAVNGARIEEKKAAAERVNMAKGNVQLINSMKEETIQRAQHDGEVTEIYPKEGELIGTGSPIMSIAMTDKMWGAFNVREDQLQGMKIGDKINVFIPAFNKNITMKVYFIKDQGTYAVWKATKANGQYDLKTFEVRATPTEKTIEGLRPGMSLILKGRK